MKIKTKKGLIPMKAKRLVTIVLCMVLVAALSVAGTLAYLTSQDSVKNTFTVGDVEITLAESDADEDGNNKANAYHLLPGHTYTKDPTVTVVKNSENSYVRMLVKVSNIDALKTALPDMVDSNELFLLQELCYDENGNQTWNSDCWACVDYNDGTYEFRYKEIVNTMDGEDDELEPLFTDITIPATIDNDSLALLQNMTIDVVAHAIQADGFADAGAAWTAFGTQHS